jgi:Mce-associated membrane protein
MPAAAALALVLVGALVATIWFGIQTVNGFIAERGHAGALEAGKEVATNFTTFDVGTADADTKRLVAGFAPDYAAAFAEDGDTIMKNLHQGQVRSTGTVTEAGLLSYDGVTSTAHVLVTVRAQVASTAAPGGQAREYRMDLTMVDKGRWLANSVEFVG